MTFDIGRQLKELRTLKQLSQRDVAAQAGVTSGFISQVEKNITSPSISTLKRLLDVLGITMADFFTRELTPTSQFFFKKDELADIGNGDIKYLLVGANRDKRKMDVLCEVYPPQADTGLLKHTGHEAGVVISGCIEVTVGDEVTMLEIGDAYYFESRIPHRFRNISDTPCKMVSVNTPSI